MGWFKDRAAERSKDASYTRKVEKMKGTSSKVNQGRSTPSAPAPYTCGARCGHPAAGVGGCLSTVRGGVCPCSYC